ncbi:recombinase family protein [Streptococcus alactolyticus]|uniref:recombinase family protein n=1 Tax=Streptococcus alactolyticus TaxID=29389 RepID=UPI003F9A55F8
MFSNQKSFSVAVYLRLSREDGDKVESDSIRNQRALISEFVKKNSDMAIVDEYIDDGYSGTNFNRPAFNRMLEDIKSGRVNCIVVKDLSRLGRNYIETGRYLERVFPFLGVRFIAINDHYDSADTKDDSSQIIIPFKNLINDAYCRDISMKIRSQLEVKMKNGQFVGSVAAYGYMKDPKKKNHLVIDEYAAEIVQFIFNLKMDGYSPTRIADKLNELGVLTPMEYKRMCGLNYTCGFRGSQQPKWCASSVIRILKNEIYTGTLVQGKTKKVNYKVDKSIQVDEKDWIRSPESHDAIIPESIFYCVRDLMNMDTRTAPTSEAVFLFSGFLKCGDCGQNMVRRTAKKNGKTYYYYHCSTYKNKEGCSSHNISEIVLEKCVKEAIQLQIALLMDVQKMMDYIKDIPKEKLSVKLLESQEINLRQQVEKYKDLKTKLYMDLKDGLIDKDEYTEISNTFRKKQEKNQEALREIEKKRDKMMAGDFELQPWIEELVEYKNVQTLNRKILVSILDSIDVYSKDRIEIHFRHEDEIGLIVDFVSTQKEEETA